MGREGERERLHTYILWGVYEGRWLYALWGIMEVGVISGMAFFRVLGGFSFVSSMVWCCFLVRVLLSSLFFHTLQSFNAGVGGVHFFFFAPRPAGIPMDLPTFFFSSYGLFEFFFSCTT